LLAMAYFKEAIGEAFNLATSREIRISDLAQWINEITENKAGIIFKERRDWDRKNRLLASIEKARKVLGYNPNMDFKDGLKQVNAWFVQNWKKIDASYKSS
jgi:UDP-glucose 4-epimerase